jgi:lipoate-protein ligase A
VNGASSEVKTSTPLPGLSQSNWEFIDTGYHSGEYNMQFDLHLVERCRFENKFFIRFYQWKPYAISLGYNQGKFMNEQKIDKAKCLDDGIDVVQRPTGGRAVLHSEELTYSVILRSEKPTILLYRDISNAILNGLKMIEQGNLALNELSLTKDNPDILNLVKTGMYNLCFNTSIKYEINHKGKKLVGSAQRKFGDIVLQHGSILIGDHHKSIVNYLSIDDRVKKIVNKEINEKTTCLNEVLGREITYKEVSRALLKGFLSSWNINLN